MVCSSGMRRLTGEIDLLGKPPVLHDQWGIDGLNLLIGDCDESFPALPVALRVE